MILQRILFYPKYTKNINSSQTIVDYYDAIIVHVRQVILNFFALTLHL